MHLFIDKRWDVRRRDVCNLRGDEELHNYIISSIFPLSTKKAIKYSKAPSLARNGTELSSTQQVFSMAFEKKSQFCLRLPRTDITLGCFFPEKWLWEQYTYYMFSNVCFFQGHMTMGNGNLNQGISNPSLILMIRLTQCFRFSDVLALALENYHNRRNLAETLALVQMHQA